MQCTLCQRFLPASVPSWRVAAACTRVALVGLHVQPSLRHYSSSTTGNGEQPSERKIPAQLEGKNWRDLRKKQRLEHDLWRPKKRLTRYQMDHLKTLKQMQPEEWTNVKLANHFGICVSSVIRILKSKYDPPSAVRERQDARALEQREERKKKFMEKLSERTRKGELQKRTRSDENSQ